MDGGEHQGHCTAHQTGVVAEGRLWRAGRVCLRVLSLVAAMLAGELGLGIGGVIDIDKGLENKREKGGNATKHTGIETSKRPKLVGIQHQGAPRRPRKQRGALGGGERSRGQASQPLQTSMAAKQPPGCRLSLGCSSAVPRGGIGCKQAPEYCLMEPAKAQLNQVRGHQVAEAAAQSLLRPGLPFCPTSESLSQDRACCFQSHPCSLVVAKPQVSCRLPLSWTEFHGLFPKSFCCLHTPPPTPDHDPNTHPRWR